MPNITRNAPSFNSQTMALFKLWCRLNLSGYFLCMQRTDLNIYHLSTIHIEPEIMQDNLVVSIPYL